jgi:hypothetical protein
MGFTQWQWHYNNTKHRYIHHHLKKKDKSAHKATQTMKDILQGMNKM